MSKAKVYLSTLLLLAFTLTACGKKHSTDSSYDEQMNTSPLKKDRPLNDLTKNLQLASNTPAGLGTLLVLKKGLFRTSVNLCTAFLVDKNLLLTNSHCIPDTLKDTPDLDCGNILQTVIQTDNNLVRTKCEKIIKFSPTSKSVENEDDYALIQIAENITLSRYFSIDRSGFSENEKVVALTLDHTTNNGMIYGQFLEHNCLIKNSDIYGKVNSPASSPIVGFKEKQSSDRCKITPSNSGSPVITNNYSVTGIIQRGYTPRKGISKFDPAIKNVSTQIGVITNFRCVVFGHTKLDNNIPPSCTEEDKTSKSNNTNENFVEEKINTFFKTAIDSHSDNIEYDIKSVEIDKDKKKIFVVPRCVKPIQSWSKSQLSKVKYWFGKKSYKFTTNTYEVTNSNNFDYYGVLSPDFKSSIVAVNSFELSNLQKMNINKAVNLKSDQKEALMELADEISECQ